MVRSHGANDNCQEERNSPPANENGFHFIPTSCRMFLRRILGFRQGQSISTRLWIIPPLSTILWKFSDTVEIPTHRGIYSKNVVQSKVKSLQNGRIIF